MRIHSASQWGHASGFRIGQCFLGLNQPTKAIDWWQKFIKESPAGPWRGQAYVALVDVTLELAYTIINQQDFPGWGYMLSQGATTFWEQWNGSWSQIHSCYVSPGSWFYQGLAGIRPDETGPGFKKIIIKPAIVGDITWVKCSYDSIHGRIVSNWNRDGDKLTMDVTIPANTTATVYVPANDATRVTESGKPAAKAEGVKFLYMENAASVYEVGSGCYQFVS